MLPRSTSVPAPLRRRVCTARLRRAEAGARQPAAPRLRQWLAAPGSLTARLRLHGAVSVVVVEQGTRALWPQERRALGCAVGHVREVVLHIDGRAAVWARSTVSVRAVKGPWRAIRGLGTRPLAELLFSHHAVRRGPLCGLVLPSGGPSHRHLSRQWRQIAPGDTRLPLLGADAAPRWARHSLFHHHGQRLQVLEAFAPWVSKLSCVAR